MSEYDVIVETENDDITLTQLGDEGELGYFLDSNTIRIKKTDIDKLIEDLKKQK